MKILDFINLSDLKTKCESDKTKYLCFYFYKERKEIVFSMPQITELFSNAGLSLPNSSRLKGKLIKEKVMKCLKGSTSLEFVPAVLEQLEEECGKWWYDFESIDSSSEILDETKFCGKRNYLDKLIFQINSSYKNNCYDACAVLLRRLFEIALILAYQNLGIDNEIKNADGTYFLLDPIVKNAINNKVLNLSRIKNEFDKFRKVGNFSAHRIEYTAGKKDIDDIRLDYRASLEELFNKAGLM